VGSVAQIPSILTLIDLGQGMLTEASTFIVWAGLCALCKRGPCFACSHPTRRDRKERHEFVVPMKPDAIQYLRLLVLEQ
jgi:hypothetical protein